MAKKRLLAFFVSMVFVVSAIVPLVACKSKAELSAIEITKEPDKVVYLAGESFDPAGMVVTAKYSDETTKELTAEDWTYDNAKLTLTDGVYEASKNVKISYTDGDVTKTANQKVTVHNNITEATIKTQPNKTAYFVTQKFDPTGMVVSVTLEDGSKKDVTITANNATFAPEVMSSSTKEVVVTIGGKELKVPVEVENKIYAEAEDGYKNGVLIEKTDGDSGSIRTDATTEKAQAAAENLYKAQLKADFAKAELKKAGVDVDALDQEASEKTQINVGGKPVSKLYDEVVAWLNNADNKAAIDAYVASDEFKNAVDAYVKSAQYEEDYKHYIAHDGGDGEHYLGQINQGDSISFVFDSSAATKGSIAFRLASSYLYRDNNGGWLAVIMGDIQFNKLCEFYVNGVKAEVGDDVILEGGMTADGSADNILWCNWKEMQFDNVDFVAGRNVVEIKFKRHGIVAANNYNFAANLDTLIVELPESSNAVLGAYDNSTAKAEATVTSASIDQKGTLKVEGTVKGATGYVGDLLSVSVGDALVSVTTNNGKFTATGDLTTLEPGEYPLYVSGASVKVNVSSTPVQIGDNSYSLTNADDGTVKLVVDSNYKVVVNSATLGTDIKPEVRDGKIYFVIAGGTYEAEVKGYTEAEATELLQAKLKDWFYFDVQENKNEGAAAWATYLANAHTIKVDYENSTFELLVDLSSLNTNALTVHCAENSKKTDTDGWNDFKPNIEAFAENKKVELNGTTVEVIYDKTTYFACVGIKVTVTNAPAINVTKVELKETDGKAAMVISGTVENKPEGEVKFDLETVLNGGDYATVKRNITVTWNGANFVATFDLSALEAGKSYWIHFDFEGKTGDLPSVEKETIKFTLGNLAYELVPATTAENSPLIYVKDTAAKTVDPNKTITLEEADGKVYLVLTGTYQNYTLDELKAALAFDVESAADWSKTNIDASKVTVTIDADKGTFVAKVDLSDLPVGEYLVHLYVDGGSAIDIGNENGIAEIACGNNTYSYANHNFGTWSRFVLTIKAK